MTNKQDLAHIHTVSGLTREIKSLLEEHYPFVWITGEISNLALPASGHAYFSLKDDNAIINCVIFKNQKKRLPFNPENGIKVTGLGRISLYEPRGSYQLIIEHMTPEGAGNLQVQFEQLKKQLYQEGLFDEAYKKEIPFLPRKIGIVTSPTGAVIRDIIHVSTRRFPTVHLEIFPVKVQGDGAENEIKRAIEIFNGRQNPPDVIIVARGGGSLEDLTPFNSETVARGVFDSEIPIVSAVGHETDYTICDFVADLRAPTPSAAAELALPEKQVLNHTIRVWEERLDSAFQNQITRARKAVNELNGRLKNPLSLVQDMRLKLDDLAQRLNGGMDRIVSNRRKHLGWIDNALLAANPQKRIPGHREDTEQLTIRLSHAMANLIKRQRASLCGAQSNLDALSPMAVLDRGYSISRRCRDNHILRVASEVDIGDDVEVILSRGRILCRVEQNEIEK